MTFEVVVDDTAEPAFAMTLLDFVAEFCVGIRLEPEEVLTEACEQLPADARTVTLDTAPDPYSRTVPGETAGDVAGDSDRIGEVGEVARDASANEAVMGKRRTPAGTVLLEAMPRHGSIHLELASPQSLWRGALGGSGVTFIPEFKSFVASGRL